MGSKWKLRLYAGWYAGNPSKGLMVEILSPVPDYPKGWIGFNILLIQLAKFEFCLTFNKVQK